MRIIIKMNQRLTWIMNNGELQRRNMRI